MITNVVSPVSSFSVEVFTRESPPAIDWYSLEEEKGVGSVQRIFVHKPDTISNQLKRED